MIGTKAERETKGKALAIGCLLTVVLLCVLLAARPAHAATFTVNSTADEGDQSPGNSICDTEPFPVGTKPKCTLRAAIQETNATTAADTITFNIGGSGVKTISPMSAFPAITEQVTIDGYSEPGARANSSAVGSNAVLLVELNGANVSTGKQDGFDLRASNSVIRGLVINRFGFSGISALLPTADGNKVEGNFIGTDPSGTQDLGNDDNGVSISSSSNTIGGASPAARNLISGNTDSGVSIVSGNKVEGNLIGTTNDGSTALGNGGHGVQIFDSSNTVRRNTIAFNGGDGVTVFLDDATGNGILSNSIYNNGGLGIDLRIDLGVGGVGPTPNDLGDADLGPNNFQNFPVLSSAARSGTKTAVKGTLNSTANTAFTLQFFSGPTADQSGFGEGKRFLGQLTGVTTNGSGKASFTAPTQAGPAAQVVTATATNEVTKDTSEFSKAVRITADRVKPAIKPVSPRPGSRSFKRLARVRAIVRDNVTDLAKGNIRLFVDGKRKAGFTYNRTTDRLSFAARRLSFKRHRVRIVARDGAGNVAGRSWGFTVKKKRH